MKTHGKNETIMTMNNTRKNTKYSVIKDKKKKDKTKDKRQRQ